MNNNYIFEVNSVFYAIENHWRNFMDKTHASKCVIGISGGIDSTCVAALACKIFGKENVIGISLPCDIQHDMDDVNAVFDVLGIKRIDFNIGDAFHSILDGVENSAIEISDVTRTNLPARLRMASLYAFAQSIPGALVINTCNLSETLQNYDTLWGDNCGSYAPIKDLTKTEVRKLAEFLGVPMKLVMKTPIDGLQKYSDEARFGYSYAELDDYIRNGIGYMALIAKMISRYNSGKFKIDMVHIDGPTFEFPDYIQEKNI